jgi:succinate-semialdehyde dehydrogenase
MSDLSPISALNVATSRNPATGELIATYPFQTQSEVEQLLDVNAAAFRLWRATPMRERVSAYRRLAATLRERSDSFAALITAEMGKTLAAARGEVEKCAATLEWIADSPMSRSR